MPSRPWDRRRWARLYGSGKGLVIVPNAAEAGRIADEVQFFGGDGLAPLAFPDWETLPYDRLQHAHARTDERVDRDALCERLIRGGYRAVSQVIEHGDYALPGSFLDGFRRFVPAEPDQDEGGPPARRRVGAGGRHLSTRTGSTRPKHRPQSPRGTPNGASGAKEPAFTFRALLPVLGSLHSNSG